MEKYIDRREEKDRREKSNGCTLRVDSFAIYAYQPYRPQKSSPVQDHQQQQQQQNQWKWRLFPLILSLGITNRLSYMCKIEKVTYSINGIFFSAFSLLQNFSLSNKAYFSRNFFPSQSKIKTQKARHKPCLDNGSHNNAQTPEEECKR